MNSQFAIRDAQSRQTLRVAIKDVPPNNLGIKNYHFTKGVIYEGL